MRGLLQLLGLTILGWLVLYCCSFIQTGAPLKTSDYYYTGFLKSQHTILGIIALGIVAGLMGYFTEWNPLQIGIGLVLIFPVAMFYEISIYKGSHNLFPLEVAVYLLYSLPNILAAYIGRIIREKFM